MLCGDPVGRNLIWRCEGSVGARRTLQRYVGILPAAFKVSRGQSDVTGPKGPEQHSPGQRPGKALPLPVNRRPDRAKYLPSPVSPIQGDSVLPWP